MTAADRAALAERGASIIHQGFEAYHRDFLEVTRRARGRFERQDWPGALADTRERLDLYGRRITAPRSPTPSCLEGSRFPRDVTRRCTATGRA